MQQDKKSSIDNDCVKLINPAFEDAYIDWFSLPLFDEEEPINTNHPGLFKVVDAILAAIKHDLRFTEKISSQS